MSKEMEDMLFSAIKRRNHKLAKVSDVITELYDMRLDAISRGNGEEWRTLQRVGDMLREAMKDDEEVTE